MAKIRIMDQLSASLFPSPPGFLSSSQLLLLISLNNLLLLICHCSRALPFTASLILPLALPFLCPFLSTQPSLQAHCFSLPLLWAQVRLWLYRVTISLMVLDGSSFKRCK